MPLSGNNKYINIESKAPEIFRRFFYGLIPICTAIDIKLFWACLPTFLVGVPRHLAGRAVRCKSSSRPKA
jgi:hypothetical protein